MRLTIVFLHYCRALKYKPLSLTDDDLPTPGTTDLMNDPDLLYYLTNKSQSATNLHTVAEHSPASNNSVSHDELY